jgi:hypothetical protein
MPGCSLGGGAEEIIKKRMLLTYLDQNALLALGYKARSADYRKKIDAMLESGSLKRLRDAAHKSILCESLNPMSQKGQRHRRRIELKLPGKY